MTALLVIVAILAFGVMIAIHEAGHFFTAKACGVKIYEFSLGMGPRLFGWVGKDETKYNFRLFPIGGFVSMKGEDEDEKGEDSFSEKKPWQKFLITAAGAIMNLLLGFIISLGLVLSTTLASNVVGEFVPDAVSDEWLRIGDEIVEINGSAVHTYDDMQYEILHDGYEPLDMVVIRDGERVNLHGVQFETVEESGVVFGLRDFLVMPAEKNVGNVLVHTWYMGVSTVKMIWESLVDLFSGRVGMEAVSGPVGVTEAIGTAASLGAYNLFYLLAALTMNLGVFNLLPFPALDGGRLVFILFEMIFRRKVSPKVEGFVHFIGITLLLALMVFVTFKDVVGLFK
ncbi:MAG: site-2 protease family protein [Ruminococcaceae bacterium]|nr:site-2 protease family protein [Oscillospiraceae bacterium]